MAKLCFGCMQQKENSPICELCGFDERMENQPHQLPIGTILQNQYLVGRVLGQGGFGITYIGWDQHLSIPVAIKEYYPGGVVQRNTRWSTEVMCANGEAPEVFEKHKIRFLKEARTLAQLSGIPEIVQIKSFFPENGTAYIVMEYVEGITLKDHLKRLGRPMTEGEALTIMEPVLKALQKVHEHGLIHRDISPDNIMLPASGGVKLIDFGTVRYMDDSGKSKSTEAVLKPGFAPMEQYNTRGNLGTWTDVYAICATFHYLLTGKVPADVHDRLDDGESLTLLRSKVGISRKLVTVLENGMKLRYQERVQTIGELCQLLYSAAKTSPAKKQTKGKYAKQPEKIKASPKKRKGGLLAVCAVAAIAIGAAAMLLIPKKQEPGASLSVPESTEPFILTTVPDTAESAVLETSESTVPETTKPVTLESIAYSEAEQLLAEGETAKAAIAFGKLAGYKDARERSFALWNEVARRDTIAVGDYHTLALRQDGTVAVSGSNVRNVNVVTHGITRLPPENSQCNVEEWTDIVAVDAYWANSVGLKADGTVVVAGLLTRDGMDSSILTWNDIVSIDVETNCLVGLKLDGTVVVSGGYADLPGLSDWTDIVDIQLRGSCCFGLKADGTVLATAHNPEFYEQCNVGNWSDIVKIRANHCDIFGIKADGTIVFAGSNRNGQCNVQDWTNIVDLCANGYYSTIGVKADGTTVMVGRKLSWYDTTQWTDIVSVAASENHAIGLRKDGTLVATGNTEFGRCDVSDWSGIQLPTRTWLS